MKTADSATLQDATYQRLRQWLTVGRVVPGERLKIKALAEKLGVGQMPVRAALQRLAAEGALKNVPNAGVTVPKLSRAEFDDILATRLLLEGEAAERGARQLSVAGRLDAERLSRDMAKAIAENRLDDYLDANEAFHLLLYRAAGSPLLLDLIDTVWMRIGPLSTRLDEDPHVWASMNDAHEDIVAALQRQDAAAVRRGIEKDLFCAGQYLRSACD
ncbi:MAG: GntR family transcriptional regulator [Rhodocyclaceae bacterium]|nr:GntR family transcriptional regulator [Rhodocyclaceae bacterium]MBK6908842.1 GntR family transcriptional regulator [Rhodocyclaceae bacterium]